MKLTHLALNKLQKWRMQTWMRVIRTTLMRYEHHHGANWPFLQGLQMDMNSFFNDLQGKINQAIESSPAKDIEKNVKAMMTQGFSKLDLVTREEFDIQNQVLAKTRAKLEALELRVQQLEESLAAQKG
jgi:BMFP domain-containing protein YqiC